MEKAIQQDLIVYSTLTGSPVSGLPDLAHPKCPCADNLSPLPGVVNPVPAGLTLQLGEPELPSPLALDEAAEVFPVCLTGLIHSTDHFGGMKRVELPSSTHSNTCTMVSWLEP